jgi:hypothetical protein
MATASTNTVASALSQARASGVLSQSKPATPTNQMNSAILLKSQSDSEVETSKTNVNAEFIITQPCRPSYILMISQVDNI